MKPIIDTIRAMLASGQVNPGDRWHADQLVNHTKAEDLSDANLNWLRSLSERNGAPFKKP